MKVARIAVNFPQKNDGLFYFYDGDLKRGDVVEVPLGKRSEWGCVLSSDESTSQDFLNTPSDKIKSILHIYKNWSLTEMELNLFEWMASYYHYPLGQLIFDCLPKYLKRPQKFDLLSGQSQELEFQPTPTQEEIIGKINSAPKGFKRHLIHGVTGSGKTTVYLKIIQETLKQGMSVLFLLPEINLTPQFVSTFSKYISSPLVVYHSEISDSQKFHIWQKARDGGPLFILGVRSSIFIPLKDLGCIIIDEEHDSSFKQDDRCPYNARDVAAKKAQILGIPLILGSATPSLETYWSFHQNGMSLFEMKSRAGSGELPKIELIDAKEKSQANSQGDSDLWPLVDSSRIAIENALHRGEQVLVFVNRLGFASSLQCRGCGHQFNCPNCTVNLRFFKHKNQLSCQHCDYKESLAGQCPKCGCLTLMNKGFGTERIQEVLKKLFPEKRIERFDRDEIKNIRLLEERLDEFHRGDIDLLVGTQMLSKGHNFERVKLVLILGIDHQLNFPDFRSGERVYQTLTQVAGRAGRFSKEGRVLIQTLNPDTKLFQQVESHSFHEFYQDELKIREICECSPFQRMAMIHFTGRFQDRLIVHVTGHVAPLVGGLIKKHFSEVTLSGPRPAMIEKKSNQFTWSVLLKSKDAGKLHNLIKSFEMNYKSQTSITYKIDIDPYTLV